MMFDPLRHLTALRLVAAGALFAVLVACGQQSPEKLMASAKENLAKGDRSAAVIHLKNLLQQKPDNGEARQLLGQALLDNEEFVSAEKELSRALALKQPHEKVVPPYAQALLAQGKFKEVVTEVEKYKLYNPLAVAMTQTALGDAYSSLGNLARARDAYAAALAAMPGHGRAKLGEAKLAATEGRLDDALKLTEEAVSADAKLAEARAYKAVILLAKGDRAEAKKELEAAVEADGRFLPARLSLISLLTDDREFDAAAKLIESARKVAPNDIKVTYYEAALSFRKGELEKARQQIQQVLKFLPEHVPTLLLSAMIDLQDNRPTAAEISLSKAVSRAPNHQGARSLLVQTYLRLGQPARAKAALQPLVERGIPKDSQLLMLAGETYLANGNVREATAFYQAASQNTASNQVAARTRLGQIALATGRSDEGFKELEAASDLDAGAYQADLALIAGHMRRQEFDKAMAAARALEKKQPKNPLTFQMYGEINLAKRDLDAARKNFEKVLELQPANVPAAYNLALLDLLAKKPEDARKRYEAMIAKEPKNDQLYIALADLQERTGAPAKEITATLQRGLAAAPQAQAMRLAMMSYQLRIGDAKAALTAAQEGLAAFPADPRVLEIAGVAQQAAGEINQAIGTFNKLASLQPTATKPLYRLAELYMQQNNFDDAIETLRRVQKIAPRERDVVPQLVQVYVAAKRFDDAIREAREVQKREPKFAGGYSLEGYIYAAQAKYAEAEKLFRQSLKIEPGAKGVAVRLHGTLMAAGKPAEAESFARKWIAENPKDPAMHVYLGERALAAKDLKVAATHFEAVIAIEPGNAPALNNLAWIGGQLGDRRALGYAERAVQLAPSNSAVLDTYGALLLKAGDVEKALPVLERANKLAPARSDVRLNYAKALIKSGRKEDARKELEVLQGVKGDFSGKDEVAGLLKGL